MTSLSPGGPPSRAVGASRWWTLLEWSNPYSLAFAPYQRPGRIGLETYLGFLAGCLVLSAALVLLATVRVRRRGAEAGGSPGDPGRMARFRSAAPARPVAGRATRWRGGSGTARGRHG